jgi:Tfp pilus assembly protein PilW
MTMRTPLSLRHQQGVGLVELMLAMVLGLFISAMALEYFLASRSTLNTTSAVSYLQESARHTTRRLQPLIRNTGFSGCTDSSSVSDGTGSHALSETPLAADPETARIGQNKCAVEMRRLATHHA